MGKRCAAATPANTSPSTSKPSTPGTPANRYPNYGSPPARACPASPQPAELGVNYWTATYSDPARLQGRAHWDTCLRTAPGSRIAALSYTLVVPEHHYLETWRGEATPRDCE